MSDKERGCVAGIISTLLLIAIVLGFGWLMCDDKWTKAAIKHGAMRYNATTGQREWVAKEEGE